MSNTENDHTEGSRSVSRRRFMQATGVAGVTAGVAGCLGDDDEAVQITMDGEWTDIEDDVIQALYDAGLDEDIEVDILSGDFETGARQADFTSALDAGRSRPDIFMMDSGWTIPFVVREQLVNLSEELSSDTVDYVQDSYLSAAVDTASHPETGDLYGLPLFPDYPMIHYRKDLVEEAGYDPDGENWATEPMSWQEFAEVVADVWDQNPDMEYGFTTQGDNYEGTSCCAFNEIMTSMGGAYFGDHENLFGPVGDRPITVDEEPVHETLRMMRSFMYGPDAEDAHPDFPQITTSDLVEFTEEPSREPFTGGNAIFHRNWPYVIPINATDAAFDFEDHAVMPMPYGVEEGEGAHAGTGGTQHALGGWHLTVNPNTPRLDESLQVLEAFANENVMLTNFEEGGYIPPDPSVTQGADPDALDNLGRFLDTIAVAGENTVARPVTTAWPEQSPLISSEIHDAYTGEKTPEEAMSDLESALEQAEQQ
ncbi:substrate-binding domain-containing protein [Halorubrum tibetense]|uniref:Substrate-binding domain-containing protein n=1 Tax=Halorubrum tibetense TaxID=175631 RepID=A0ABD5S827_9EURY